MCSHLQESCIRPVMGNCCSCLQVLHTVTHAFWWAGLQTRGLCHHFFIHSFELLLFFLSSDCSRTDTERAYCFDPPPPPPPQLLVQFVQNASIPLVQSLEDSDSKHSCLPLLAPAESSLCSPLELTGPSLTVHLQTSVEVLLARPLFKGLIGTHRDSANTVMKW